MTDVLRHRSVKPGFGRRWEHVQQQAPPAPVQDHTREIVTLEAECETLRNRLDEVEASKSVSLTLKNQVALLETRIENERKEHDRARKDYEEQLRSQQSKYEAMIQEAADEPRKIDREVEEIIEMQRRLLKHKDEEIRHLSEIAAAHKEQLALLQCFLKDGLDDVGQDILHVNRRSTLELLGQADLPSDGHSDRR